jgi:PAS domain S-box-containing protein
MVVQRTEDAENTIEAFARGKGESAALEASATPVSLHAAQESLRRSEQLLRAIFDGALDAMLLADANDFYLDANPAACELFGFRRERIIGHNIAEFAAPEYDREAAHQTCLTQGHMRGRFPLLRPDGSRRVLDYSVVANVAPGVTLSVLRDITDRVAAEEALKASELRFRRLIEDLPEAVLVHVDNHIAYANSASASLLGLAGPAELVGRAIVDFATPATCSPTEAPGTATVENGDQVDLVEQSIVRPSDGRELRVEVKSIPIVYNGRPATLSVKRDVTRRVEAERETAKALLAADRERRKLEAVLAALPVGVWIADATGGLVQTNPAAARIWGGQAPHARTPSEYGIYKAFWPSTGEALGAEEWALARTFKTGETIVAEAVDIERFDGTRGHVLNSTAPILDDQGLMIGGVVVILDVTDAQEATRERERLIASLDHERRRLGTLLEKAPAFIAVLRGREHVFELANEAYFDLTGRRELIGKPVIEALPELQGEGFVELLTEVLETGKPFVANGMPVTVTRGPRSQPERRFLNFVYQPLIEADGTRTGVFVHGVDVTEATLSQQRIRAQFRGVPAPTYIWQRVERDGAKHFVLVDFNQAAITMSHGKIAEDLGVSAATYFSDAPAVLEELERCLDGGATIQREMDRRLKSTGETRRLFVTYAPAPPDLVIVHTEDVTDRTKLEQQFRQAQKMEAVGRLAGGVAHDFNNLLSVILSYAELASNTLKPGDPLRADLAQIRGAGERATELTRQLLAFSRQQVLQLRVVDLRVIIAEMKPMLGRLLGEDVDLCTLMAPGHGRVLADPSQLEQVVMNLAVNARDAMPEGGKLTIETTDVEIDAAYVSAHEGASVGSYVRLAVSDTGTGMDAATRARLFEPFFTTKVQGKGTGLGLATVFGIVKQSGGYVIVDSEPGRGSTFVIHLPRTDRVADAAVPHRPAVVLGGSETILLVEDEEHVRAVACIILRRHGYHVLEAANGGEAFLISKDFPAKIHLLLTDVVMPRISGRKVAEQLALERPEMKVLFASGYTDDAIVRDGIEDSDLAFLQKPFTPDALLRKVREVLDDVAPRMTASAAPL